MDIKKETKIIKASIKNAIKKFDSEHITRNAVAREACIIADKKGVNIMAMPYRQDIFYKILEINFK